MDTFLFHEIYQINVYYEIHKHYIKQIPIKSENEAILKNYKNME